ncbi:MAG: TIGR01841 family phasin [Burkholderiales bacterium]|nr:TIGR01841 family phasin [Burkholderiales bacterium]
MATARKAPAKSARKSPRKAAPKSAPKAAPKSAPKTESAGGAGARDAQAAASTFADVASMLKGFKVPGVDIAALIESQKKDVQALVSANKAAYQGMQSLAKRQTEMLQEAAAAWRAAAAELTTKGLAGSMEERTELARKAFSTAVGNMRELAEMATRSQTEVFDLIRRRAEENLAALKSMMGQK